MKKATPQRQLDTFIDKFAPELAEQVREALKKMCSRLPSATLLVYDNYNALAIGFAPGDRTSDAVFSLAVYPRWVSLFFLRNALALKDPRHLLQGKGNVVRHILLETAETLDSPAVKSLMKEALRLSDALQLAHPPANPTEASRLIIKSVSEKQRARRPAVKS